MANESKDTTDIAQIFWKISNWRKGRTTLLSDDLVGALAITNGLN